jgi:hypothetical protein
MSWGNDTEVTDEGVRIRLLGFPKTIPFAKIRSVKKAPYWKVAFCNMGSVKTILGLWRMPLEGGVVIETQFFWWVVRPENKDEFVKLVSSHLTNPN